jgi:hypothetical protein
MDALGASELWSFVNGETKAKPIKPSNIRSDPGVLVHSYLEMARKVAELQFRNREFVLLFRGQRADHKTNAGLSTFRPSIFRPKKGRVLLGQRTLAQRLDLLREAEALLTTKFNEKHGLGRTRVERQRLLRWAILQHYDVCDTPLLDVTQSLRIAASFACHEASDSFVYAFAIPNLSGTVTVSAETGIQVVRLSGACPPSAIRPHIQEGYLVGEYPDIETIEQARTYKPGQFDFWRRLLAKFRFRSSTFLRDEDFPMVKYDSLHPKGRSWFEDAISDIGSQLSSRRDALR